jgi:hypothetical protein
MDAYVEAIKQYPGMVQVTRKVKVDVPGKHFPQLQAAEQKQSYSGTAVEYAERHKFDRHLKAWGQAHTGPGIRFICDSDAIDDPDHKGFWTTLGLWNRWRHDTYKDNRDAELQYLDMKPVEALTPVEVEKKEKAPPEIKQHFTVVSTGTHTVAGTGKMAGKVLPCIYFACKQPGCTRGVANPIKQVGTATGALFTHLDTCNPSLCKVLRGRSAYSPVVLTEDGEEYELYSFDELLPHHARFVQWCFRGWRHFYEGRSKNGLIEYIHGYDRRASLPAEQTCQQLLEVYEELMDEKLMIILELHKAAFGTPCAGSTSDIWSLKSCRESFGCLRLSVTVDGAILHQVTGHAEYSGCLIDMSPILAFATFAETRHTGAALARWKSDVLSRWKYEKAVGLATEDGASNNKTANRILGQDMMVCVPHDLARAILHASGLHGGVSKNRELADWTKRAGKQSAAFNRSVVANKALQQAQLDADPDLKSHKVLATKVKNTTRWLGLFAMTHANRLIGPEIRKALTGQECGVSFEDAAEPAQRATCQRDESGSGSEAGDSSGDDQEEGNRAKGKEYPLAHRCIDSTDWCVPPPLPFSLSILFSSVTLYSQAPQRHLRESSRSP